MLTPQVCKAKGKEDIKLLVTYFNCWQNIKKQVAFNFHLCSSSCRCPHSNFQIMNATFLICCIRQKEITTRSQRYMNMLTLTNLFLTWNTNHREIYRLWCQEWYTSQWVEESKWKVGQSNTKERQRTRTRTRTRRTSQLMAIKENDAYFLICGVSHQIYGRMTRVKQMSIKVTQ